MTPRMNKQQIRHNLRAINPGLFLPFHVHGLIHVREEINLLISIILQLSHMPTT
jgi:hypothetical protein